MLIPLLLIAIIAPPTDHVSSQPSPAEMVAAAEAYRSARDSGDYPTARQYLVADARMWFEEKTGEGRPIVLGDGPYDRWDEHFESETSHGEWQADSNTIWTVVTEWNDYYRLLEREDTTRYRLTFYFADNGLIAGYKVSSADVNGLNAPRDDRFAEFKAWAEEHHPREWEYLRPDGIFDPTGDRAVRTRTLLNAWRESVGLEPIW
ncbi:MAG: hypothetical protein GF341_13460 [candidate division Zixibacteria bacterium]|nr:hypothetical protein [candidate division Zixibacteria bacterium]